MKLLVANRGEIASRVFATARRLGWRTVAVYAEPDRDAPFVRQADESRCIGPAALDQSYLSASAVLDAAAATGADAVHPGYGFLSENAEFAQAVIAAGLTWVGPHPDAIARMGAKIEARAVAETAGVPTIPGASDGDLAETHDNSETADAPMTRGTRDGDLAAAADQIGFPVLVKASAGGGGKGIRIVRSASEFDAALSEARTEALRSFGDDRVIVERYIERPRHVEVQVVGDQHGNVIHLGTRDCSSQRRYQKLLEEAPAPNLPDTTREGLHSAAVTLARHIGYDNAGTVEFIVDADTGEFFFLETNTRLQVEHPVTEAVTGLDLVELQLRAAVGEPLGVAQADVTFDGHSIEARINAEDPADGFSPRAGPVRHLAVPPDVRWDASVAAGSSITPYYDPMAAKLIVSGPTRDAALDSLRDALDRLVLGPVPTNAGFLRWLIDTPQLRDSQMTTNVIDALDAEHFPQPPLADEAAPVAAAAWLDHLRCQRGTSSGSPWTGLGPFRLTEHQSAAVVILRDTDGNLHEIAAEALARPYRAPEEAADNGEIGTAPSSRNRSPATHAATDVQSVSVGPRAASSVTDDSVAVNIDGYTFTFAVPDRSDAWAHSGAADAGTADAVAAPFPAVVVEVPVAPGDHVSAGDAVAVVEAMKMLHSLTAPGAGTVAEVRCSPGEAVEANQVLVTFAQS